VAKVISQRKGRVYTTARGEATKTRLLIQDSRFETGGQTKNAVARPKWKLSLGDLRSALRILRFSQPCVSGEGI
jgi:hypothetical protein